MGEEVLKIIKKLNYDNAGTIEFIYDEKNKKYYFLELNTRLQNRGTDSAEEIERRLIVARSEMEQEKYYDYTIVSQYKSADLEAALEIYKNEVARQR